MIKPTKRRYGYASSDPVQRRKKAEKIIWILERRRPLRGLRILEIGTGSGIIAACLADRVGPEGDVTAVDVVDQRILRNGYRFIRVSDAGLPCEDQSFDVVVSNHVIEHVGTHSQQLTHLREIHRVLKPEGFGYLAAPNRWAIIEPHYRLPLLSWLPRLAARAIASTVANIPGMGRQVLRRAVSHSGTTIVTSTSRPNRLLTACS